MVYELKHGPIKFNSDRLAALSFNPLRMTSKNHIGLNTELDPDNALLKSFYCDYYIENQFNQMISEKSKQNSISFSTMHLNIRSINQNLSQLTDLLLNINHQFTAIGITETWLKENAHFVDIENYNFIHNHRRDQYGGGVGLYLKRKFEFQNT